MDQSRERNALAAAGFAQLYPARPLTDPALAEVRAALPGPSAPEEPAVGLHDVAVPLVVRSPLGTLRFVTTVTVFGAPRDVTLAEIAIETLLPADAATADALRQLQASLA